MKKIFFLLLFLTVFFTHVIYPNPIGWYPVQPIAQNILEYRTAQDASGQFYVVYPRLLGPFQINKKQKFSIELKDISANPLNAKTLKLYELDLPPSDVLFMTSPSVAVSTDKVMVVWQEPSANGTGMDFKYCLIDKNTFSIDKVAEIKLKNYDVFQPVIYTDYKNNFHLFFQQKLPGQNLSLAHSLYSNSSFLPPEFLIRNIKSLGRGAFFPSILFLGSKMDIVYQSRQSETLTDELFYIESKNQGKSFSTPLQITKNNYNDFSPVLFAVNDTPELVWQSNEAENWQIVYSPDFKEEIKLSEVASNKYQPVAIYGQKTGRIIAWLDQRQNPAQIFAKFIDLKADVPMSKEHQVSNLAPGCNNPDMILFQGVPNLLYMCNGNLYLQKTDMETSPLKIYSPTHPSGTITTLTDAKIMWTIGNEPSGVDGYAYLLDQRSDSKPDFYNLDGEASSVTKKGLAGGNYYFHIRYKDKAGNESPVYNYSFSVDASDPLIAEVTSPTHAENTPEKSHQFKVQFSALDDIGIKGYNYVLSPNRGALLKNFTEKTELTFDGLSDGEYYFLVQAVDKAGRLSPVASYKIKIVPPDYDDFRILNNIAGGRLESDFLDLSIQMTTQDKNLVNAYASLGKTKEDPFAKGTQLKLSKQNESFKARIPLPLNQWGIYVLTVGLEYDDQSHSSPRVFYFEYFNEAAQQAALKKQREQQIKASTIDWNNPSLFEKIKPLIELNEDRGLFKIKFSLPKKAKPLIKGFTYQLSDTPRLPEGELNYINEPVFFYNLPAGIYYVSVKPVFIKNKSNEYSNYSYLRFVVKKRKFWQSEIFWIFLSLTVLLILVIFRQKIRYKLSRFR